MTRRRIPREVLLDLVSDGLTNAELCGALGVTTRTLTRWRVADRGLAAEIDARRMQLAAERQEVTQAHGTLRRYRLGCRCDTCTTANTHTHREYVRQRRERLGLPPAQPGRGRPRKELVGTTTISGLTRRIEQAIARGEPTSMIMLIEGVSYETVQQIRDAMAGAR